jgi:uncharacterized protein involved in exopolysaccharide biosynthesis
VETRTSDPPGESSDAFGFLDLAIALAKQKRIVLGIPLLAGIVALVIALLLPPTYTASVRILPPQQKESSASAVLGSLAGVSGGLGTNVGQALGFRNPNELYVGILRGRTIGDRLIERFSLRERYEVSTMVAARRALESTTRITAGKDGLISIEVDDNDPQRAARIANAYVEELDSLMQKLALTEAAQRRLFFEKQLASARDKLVAAETELRKAIDTKGITGVDAQTRALVGTVEQLRAQIAVKEIQLDAMRAFATDQNPEAVRLRQELKSMKGELANLEGGRREGNTSTLPAGLENVRRLRELKFLEFTVELLTKQYEIAKIDEAKDAVLIQLVDPAIPPDYRSKPKRSLIVLLTMMVAGFAAVILAILREYLERARLDPHSAARLSRLSQYLRLR